MSSYRHFGYNQFFLWAGANNLIPMEIALKIANKIKQNERFSAYIVIPMWPEGAPTSIPTQRILFWQVGFFDHLKGSTITHYASDVVQIIDTD